MNQQFIELPLNKVHTRNNYRKTFNDKALKELAASIKQNGVIEPIIVRPNSTGFELIAGERRVRAAAMAQLVTIPAIVREIGDEDVLKIQLVENIQREGVSFMEEARGIRRLRDECAFDMEELARMVGKSVSYVFYQISLTRLPENAQDACDKKELLKSVAWKIAALPKSEQQEKAATDLRRSQKDKLISDRSARKYIADTFGENGIKRPRKNQIQKQNGNDYQANWKKYLIGFSCEEFTFWQELVGNKTDIETWSKAVERVMSNK